MLPTRENILRSLETRDSYSAAAIEGAAARGELGVQAYILAHELDRAPVAIDVVDLHAAFKRCRAEAAAMLGMLSRPQLIAVAWAYAAHLNALGRDVSADAVLSNFDRGLAAYSVKV